MKMVPGIFFAALISFGGIHADGAELISASDLLEQIEKARGQGAGKTNQTNPGLAQLRNDLTNFIQRRAEVAAPEAAAQWVSLVERARTNQDTRNPRAGMINPIELLSALPEPAAWPELEKITGGKAMKTPADVALRVISARLVNQIDRATAAIDAYSKTASETESYSVESLREAINRAGNQSAEALLKQLDRLASASGRGEIDRVELPKLVPAMTEADAEAALKKVLPKIKVPIQANYQQANFNYAWKAALAVVDQLPIPQWGLIQSEAAAPLYEALEKKFAKESVETEEDEKLPGRRSFGSENSEARRHYLTALIKRGDIAKAAEIVRKQKSSLIYIDSRNERIPPARLTEFYLTVLKEKPSLPWWDELSVAAAQSGQTAEALKLAEDSLKTPDLAPEVQGALRSVVANSKLADDRVEEGLAAVRELAKEGKSERGGAMRLALLGAALKRPELMKEAIAATVDRGAPSPEYNYSGNSAYFGGYSEMISGDSVALLLNEHGLPTEALGLASKSLEKIGRQGGAPALRTIATIYVRQNKAADALVLLERSPDWGIDDVAKTLRAEHAMSHGYTIKPLPIGFIAAAGLAASGREAEARTVLQAFLRTDAGNDRAYELLLKLDGEKAVETLEALFALDPFEERPLIWKAALQLQRRDLEGAEKTARQAIAIDPSDGEQGPGDRLRAYAVLADIRAARGATSDAEMLRNAVKAIRLSEEADLDFAAGLLRRAIGKYRESLKLFADAYCVQARLAVQMAAVGMNDDAEMHYRRAFELMPESFGRVESHCFGCEGAFGGEKAQGIAERTFAGLLQKTPDKPQLHYLLGYLRKQQGREEEAIPHLRQAVKLDPDYLNAWKLLHELSQSTKMTPQDSDDAVINMLRLDPSGRHAGYYSGANDLARLWTTIREIAPRIPEKPTRLFRLAASAEAMEKKKSELPGHLGDMDRSDYESGRYERGINRNPARTIAEDPVIQAASWMLTPMGGRF